MQKLRIVLTLLFFTALGGASLAAAGPTVILPGHETWGKQDMGMSEAVLYGDPSKPGYYVVRLKTTANWKFPPHYHPGRENVTVISGTFYAGIGPKVGKYTAFPAGSFISLPARLPHYAMTRAPAIIEISGTQPLTDVMVKK